MYKVKKAAGVILCLGIVIGALMAVGYYIKTTYTIKTVYVEGNMHYSEEEIKAIVMDGFWGDNSLYLSLKYKNKGIEGIPFVDIMDVEILSPDTIKIRVYEKVLTGYIKYLNTYMYFDKDGYVVESSAIQTMGVPQITGLEFNRIVVGEPLPVENPDVFDSILNITKLLEKYELVSEKIYFSRSGDVTLYFGSVKVALGSDMSKVEDKLMLLPSFLPSLTGKSGTLQMQSYDENGGKYTFVPEN